MKFILVSVFLFSIFFSCSNKPEHKDLAKNTTINPNSLSNFFSIESNHESNKSQLAIYKNALGKEFILQSHLSMMPFLNNSSGLLSRIVRFELIDDVIFMLDSATSHTVTNTFKQKFILAKFPIISQTNDKIVFDFNVGMQKLFIAEEWYASDFFGESGSIHDANALNIMLSYIEELQITKNNYMLIKQLTQIAVDNPEYYSDVKDYRTARVTYYLAEYKPNKSFVPTISTQKFDKNGFFETSLKIKDGKEIMHASKFGPGEIKFALSENTPESYRQAVTDGILYWNKYLTANKITIAPKSVKVTAPDFNYNVIQWVDWDTAGSAYADAQLDQRTGETLHAQVYLTSAFAVEALKDAKTLLQDLGIRDPVDKKEEKTKNKHNKSFLKRKKSFKNRLCYLDFGNRFKQDLAKLIYNLPKNKFTEAETNAMILKVSQDYVRYIAAHEVGHTLGLRHNFSGSIASNIKPKDLKNVTTQYLVKKATPKGIIPTNSVMDYQTFKNAILTGDLIAKGKQHLKYDEYAIATLYNNKKHDKNIKTPSFCTDSHLWNYVDCDIFDSGKNSAADLKQILYNEIAKTKEEKNLWMFKLSSDDFANEVLSILPNILFLMTTEAHMLSVNRNTSQLSPFLDIREKQITQQERQLINNQINEAGGLDELIPDIWNLIGSNFTELSQYQTAKSEAQKSIIHTMLVMYSEIETVIDSKLGDELEEKMNSLASKVLLSVENKDNSVEGSNNPATSMFLFPLEIRRAAATLFAKVKGERSDFMLVHKLTALESYYKTLNKITNLDFTEDIDIKELSPELRKFVIEEQEVLETLAE